MSIRSVPAPEAAPRLRSVAGLLAAMLIIIVVTAAPRAGSQAGGAAASRAGGAAIVGSVVDAGLVPLKAARVVLERTGRTTASTTTDADGLFRFERVAPGDYRVRATGSGFVETVRDVSVSSTASTVHLPLVLARPRPAGGGQNQIEMDGVPARDAKVAAQAVPPPPAPPSAAVRTSAAPVEMPPSPVSGVSGERVFAVPRAQVESLPVAAGGMIPARATDPSWNPPAGSAERYAHVDAARFHRSLDDPLSTFGADVDTASFTNVRRFLQHGQRPPADAVRVEEFINYFRYAYPVPQAGHPIGLTTEVGECPWAPSHRLVLVGARAIPSSTRRVEGRNFVLLIDVSGSMNSEDKLPLLKAAFHMLVDSLRPDDRLAIVTYAGYSGLALPSTPARERQVIHAAIDRLGAGGSTNGGQGIVQAYRVARESFVPGGVNRVLLATDGDFNVGIVGRNDLLALIQREKASGIFLSVLGVGTGNIRDDVMEMLADKGNGHYAYLDSILEARRVLVLESESTLETVAREVKFQVEFNPARVEAWKLIGYENRVMAARDFNDDRKDGGELGAGHMVTVLYEVVPAGTESGDDVAVRPAIDPLRYQVREPSATPVVRPSASPEWLTVKVRYQQPEGGASRLVQRAVMPGTATRPVFLPFASTVAEFGLLLRDSTAGPERWHALERRVSLLPVDPERASERAQLAELIGLAAQLR